MGWQDYHLHHFMVGDRRSRDGGHIYFYQPPALFDDDFLKDDELNTFLDEGKFKLNQLLKAKKETIIYDYDSGDSWEHLITLEKIIPSAPMPHPICIKAVGGLSSRRLRWHLGLYGDSRGSIPITRNIRILSNGWAGLTLILPLWI